MDVVVGDGGELLQGPVLADLAEPAHPPVAPGIVLRGDELVEQRALVDGVVEVTEAAPLVVLLDAPPGLAETMARGAEVGWQRGGDFAADAGGELAAAAVCGDADLEGAVGVDGEEGEGAEMGGIDDVDGDAVALAEGGDV